jgi:glycosyltransferase involved in cell wall biosynthesis
MKILYHHRTLGDGAEGVHVASMIRAFRRLGHEVQVASLIGEKTNVATQKTKRLGRIVRYTPRVAYEAMETAYSLAGYWMLAKAIRQWHPDLIYERHGLFNVAGVTAARRFNVPIIVEVNAPLAWERTNHETLTLRRLAERMERHAWHGADRIAVVSTPLKNHLVDRGVNPDRIAVVPNGADPSMFKPDSAARAAIRQRLGLSSGRVVVGFVGILRPWHGPELLLDAFARLRAGDRAHLLMIGDGPGRAAFEATAAAHGLRDCVTVTGRVPHEEVPQYLAALDIAVSPRATFYASPMKVPEYMATALAVAAPRTPNLRDLIRDGDTGLLFAEDDAASLAYTLGCLVNDGAMRARIGHNARHAIVNGRTWEHIAASLLDFTKDLRACG